MKKKIALVTGASGGIGGACAEKLAREGYTVLVHGCRGLRQAESLADRLCAEGHDAHAVFCDLADSESVQAMCRDVLALYHRVDALALCAGISHTGLLCDMTDAQWRAVMDVNVSGMFYLIRALAPGMVSRNEGAIVTVSSMWGRVGASCEVAYSASKAAVIGLTRALAKELGPSGVRVNCIAPGVIDTRMMDEHSDETKAALAVAEQPGMAYNPLFLYGGVGLGKTHLMHAIGHFIQDHFPNMRMLYLPSEMFTNELVAAIKNNKNVEFRNRFRNVDVLMLDDIQFIAGRDSTQEEFFHTFNALHSAGKQIIISSDKPPREIARLEERLRSRFEWGLIADIQKPDFDTRIAILRKKAENEGIEISDEMLELIAGRIESNIRELEGSLTRVNAYAKLNHCEINEEVISHALHDIAVVRDPKRITPELIIDCVADYYSLSADMLRGDSRKKEIALARHVAVYLTREMTGLSLPRIGDAFGRDHSTIINSCDKVTKMLDTSSDMKSSIADLKKIITEK